MIITQLLARLKAHSRFQLIIYIISVKLIVQQLVYFTISAVKLVLFVTNNYKWLMVYIVSQNVMKVNSLWILLLKLIQLIIARINAIDQLLSSQLKNNLLVFTPVFLIAHNINKRRLTIKFTATIRVMKFSQFTHWIVNLAVITINLMHFAWIYLAITHLWYSHLLTVNKSLKNKTNASHHVLNSSKLYKM